MYSFKFYYLEACDSFKIRQNEKILTTIEDSVCVRSVDVVGFTLQMTSVVKIYRTSGMKGFKKKNQLARVDEERSTNTTNLNLSGIELSDDTCKAIGLALRKDVFLQELDLSNCFLNDQGLSNILSGLEANKFLLTLNLKGNSIRSPGAAIIGKLLRHNNHLQNLCLEWNATGIYPEKFSYLCEGLFVNTGLKSLDLRNNQLNHLCAQSLSDVIHRNSTLQYLDLRSNNLGLVGGRVILKALSKNKSILKLDIADSEVPSEICKSIEFITKVNAERYLKTNEDMKKTRLFASKFQQLEGERTKQLKALKEQLEKKDKGIESTERWNTNKLTELQETLIEKDQMIDELTEKFKELQKRNNSMTQEKNDVALIVNEMEIKNKELRNELHLLQDKQKKEKEDIERKLMEDLGILKGENSHLKQKIQELETIKEDLDDQVVVMKSTISKLEKKSKLQEKSYEEQILTLNEQHQENLKELDQLKKKEIVMLKEEFSEIEKSLKERISHLENRRKELERQIIEKQDLITENKAQTEKTIDELKKKMKDNEDQLRKQMQERIDLLESANKKQDKLLKESLDGFYEIQKKSIENDLLLAEEARRTQQLEHMLETKDAETEASIAKVRLEVKDEIDKLKKENDSLKLKIEEMEKQHKEEMQSKDDDIKKLILKIQQLKMKLKEILQNENQRVDELQIAFASYVKSAKQATYKEMAEDEEY